MTIGLSKMHRSPSRLSPREPKIPHFGVLETPVCDINVIRTIIFPSIDILSANMNTTPSTCSS